MTGSGFREGRSPAGDCGFRSCGLLDFPWGSLASGGRTNGGVRGGTVTPAGVQGAGVHGAAPPGGPSA